MISSSNNNLNIGSDGRDIEGKRKRFTQIIGSNRYNKINMNGGSGDMDRCMKKKTANELLVVVDNRYTIVFIINDNEDSDNTKRRRGGGGGGGRRRRRIKIPTVVVKV